MSWKDIDTSGGSKDYLKLKDGDSFDVVFMGEPYTYYSIFKDPNEYDTKVPGSYFKFKLAVIIKEDGEYVSKILQGGWNLACTIKDQVDECGQDSVFKIKRTGSGKEDTRYAVIFKSKIPEDHMGELKKIELPELENKGKKRAETSQVDAADIADLPF